MASHSIFLYVWLLSLHTLFSRFIHVASCSVAHIYCCVIFLCVTLPQFVHSPVDGCLVCFQFWAIMREFAINNIYILFVKYIFTSFVGLLLSDHLWLPNLHLQPNLYRLIQDPFSSFFVYSASLSHRPFIYNTSTQCKPWVTFPVCFSPCVFCI